MWTVVQYVLCMKCISATDHQQKSYRSLTPHDHPAGISIPRAKFRADPLKSVAVHKEQRNRHTDSHTQIAVLYVYKILIYPRRKRQIPTDNKSIFVAENCHNIIIINFISPKLVETKKQ